MTEKGNKAVGQKYLKQVGEVDLGVDSNTKKEKEEKKQKVMMKILFLKTFQ